MVPELVIEEIERALALVINGRNEMLRFGDNPWPPHGTVLLAGTLVFLASIAESIDVLVDMDAARFAAIKKRHNDALQAWRDNRHDMAHHIDRAFRERADRSPIDERAGVVAARIGMTQMRPDNEILIQTGALPALSLNSAIQEAELILTEAREANRT